MINPCSTCVLPGKQPTQSNRIVFLLAGGLHLCWGIGLLVWPIDKVSAIANVCGTMPRFAAALLLIAIGTAAMSSTLVSNRYIALLLLVSQQIILGASAWAAIWCAMDGHYPDGTAAAHSHILFDQLVYVLLSLAHTAAILQTHGSEVIEWLF